MALVTLIAKCVLSRGRPGGGSKKKPLQGRGFGCCCSAERPPTANRHYLQLDGTYLVSKVPAVPTVRLCALAVAWSADAHAQSILPEDDATNAAPAMFGVRVIKLVPAVN
jgi:hypothetical protein